MTAIEVVRGGGGGGAVWAQWGSMARKDNGGGGRKRVFVFAIVWGRVCEGRRADRKLANRWTVAPISAYIRHVGGKKREEAGGRSQEAGRQAAGALG